MAHGAIKREQIDTEGAGNIATDMEVAQMVSGSLKSGINVGNRIFFNFDGPDQNAYIYFYNNESKIDAFLAWTDAWNIFEFSHEVFFHNKIMCLGNIWSDGNIGCGGKLTTDDIWSNGVILAVGDIRTLTGTILAEQKIRTADDFYADNGNGKGLVVKDKSTGVLYRIIVNRGKVACEEVV